MNTGLFNKNDLEKIKGNGKQAKKEIRKVTRSDIAIIGIGGKFGCANNLEEYWKLLVQGRCSVREFPSNRKDCITQPFQKEYGEDRLLPASYLDTIDEFDYEFFGLSLRESRTIDPAQRLLLQTIWKTLEDAGYVQDNIRGTNTGVYVGYSNDHKMDYYNYLQICEPGIKEEVSLTGNVASVLASRIAYLLDLKGPSMVVDTACSSALVAIHLACKAIINYECDMAICGGVNVDILPIPKGIDDITGIRSPKNCLRAFDDFADGIASGEGMGSILLKPLEEAENDHDHIYAVIKGSAVSQDGNSIGLTAPNASAQSSAMVKAWKRANIDPNTISYIEAHGTGTKLGDPIEIEGMEQAFRQFTNRKGFCGIGSVKANIGHLDSAAGMGSILKVILMLRYKKLVPNLHFTRPNHNIDFLKSPVYLCDSYADWVSENKLPLRCGVNGFGLSGTNCHMVLEEYQEDRKELSTEDTSKQYLFTLSAKNEEALQELVHRYACKLRIEDTYQIEDICYTSHVGRKHHEVRLACIVKEKHELIRTLEHWKDKRKEPENDVYYSTFRLVGAQKTKLENGEINDAKKNELTSQVEQLMDKRYDANSDVYRKIAKLYVQGADVPWTQWYKKEQGRKVSLPTYPFKKVSCWRKPNQQNRVSFDYGRYPLLNGEKVESYDEIIYVSYFNHENWVIGEHIVDDRCVLPGTAYVELLAEIQKSRSDWKHGIEIKNMIFLRQFFITGRETKSLHTILRKENENYRFTITSREDASDEWVVHAEGLLCVLRSEAILKQIPMAKYLNSEKIEIQEIQSNKVVHIGTHWTEIQKKVYKKDDIYIVSFDMSDQYKKEVGDFFYYPSLMDRGINSIIDVLREDTYYLPFTYGELTLVRDLPSKFYSVVKIIENQGQEVARLEVTLCDESGDIIAVAHDYVVKSVNQKYIQKDELIPLEMIWEETQKGSAWQEASQSKVPEQVLVLGQGDNVQRLSLILRSTGVLKVTGACFDFYKGDNITRIQSIEDYQKLADTIKGEVKEIIYIGGDSGINKLSIEKFEDMQRETIESVFMLIQALIQQKVTKELRILFLLPGAYQVVREDEYYEPFHSAVAAFAKVIPQEYSNIQTKVVDIRNLNGKAIVGEIVHGWDKQVVAYRNEIKYQQVLGKMKQESFKTYDQYKTEGIYIISGGLGALALETAYYMAKQSPINIVLLSRRTFVKRSEWNLVLERKIDRKSMEIINKIQAIENAGAKVIIQQVDVSDYGQLKSCIQGLRNEFHRVNGIIHCAGLVGQGLIMKESITDFRKVLAPKMKGCYYLDLLTREDIPDFMVYFSSINSITGGIGQGDYVAANAFLDGYSLYRNSIGLPTISIHWPGWNEVGMAKEHNAFHEQDLLEGISTSEATDWLGKLLSCPRKDIVVGRYKQQFKASKDRPRIEKTTTHLDEVTTNWNGETMEQRVANIWSKVLEVEAIDIYETFSNMGGDSVLATYLYKAMEQEFPKTLFITDIFTYPTVSAMANFIESKMQKTGVPVVNEEQVAQGLKVEQVAEGAKDDLDHILSKLASGTLTIDEIETMYK